MTKTLTPSDLRQFTGTEQIYRHSLVSRIVYTDGARHVAEAGEAYWLLDKIACAQLEPHVARREHGPREMGEITLISLPELEEIRRIWVVDKHEIEDHLPRIYLEETGQPYPGRRLDDNVIFGPDELNLLKESCGGDELHYQLTRELLSVERRYRSMLRRAGLFDAIEKAFGRHFYADEDDAVARARLKQSSLAAARQRGTAAPEPDGFVRDPGLFDISNEDPQEAPL